MAVEEDPVRSRSPSFALCIGRPHQTCGIWCGRCFGEGISKRQISRLVGLARCHRARSAAYLDHHGAAGAAPRCAGRPVAEGSSPHARRSGPIGGAGPRRRGGRRRLRICPRLREARRPDVDRPCLRRPQPRNGLAGDSIAIVLTYFLTAAAGMLFWIVAARTIPAHELGVQTALISLITAIGTVTAYGVGSAYKAMLSAPGCVRRKRLVDGLVITVVVSLTVGTLAGQFAGEAVGGDSISALVGACRRAGAGICSSSRTRRSLACTPRGGCRSST